MFISGLAQDNDSKYITIRIACSFAGPTLADVNGIQLEIIAN
jgi:hypothetical protein